MTCAAGLFLGACTGDLELGQRKPHPCDFIAPSGDVGIEVLTFWSRDTKEAEAFDELTARAESEDVRLQVSVTSDRDREQLQLNLQEGNSALLPNVFQVNGGSDVLQYVGEESGDSLCPLDRLVDLYGVDTKYFEAALTPSRCRDSLYAWPLSVHRSNTMLVNLDVYEKLKIAAKKRGRSLQPLDELNGTRELIDFLASAAELEVRDEKGEPVSVLSLGIQQLDPDSSSAPVGQDWVLLVLAFENLLTSYGAGAYESLWYGTGALSERELRAQLVRLSEDLRELGKLVPPRPQSWQEATVAVGEGRALLTIGGDWARAQVDPLSIREGRVVTLPFPGTSDAYVYTPDSFAVPREVDSDGGAEHRWLGDVLNHAETQVDFARQKHAIPARSNLSSTQLQGLRSEYLSSNYEQFTRCHEAKSSCRLLLAVSGLALSPNIDPCFDRVSRVLAVLAGLKSAPVTEETCARPMPSSFEAAQEELTRELLSASRQGFHRECRTAR